MFRRHGPTCLFLKTLKFKTSKVCTEMLDKFSGRISMTNGKPLADLSPQKSNKKHSPLMRLRMWQNSTNNFCFLKISPRIMPEVPNIEGKKGTLKHVAQLQLQLQRTTFDQHPLWKKTGIQSWFFRRLWWFWSICRSRNRRYVKRGNTIWGSFLRSPNFERQIPYSRSVKHQVPGRGLPVYPLQPHWVNR